MRFAFDFNGSRVLVNDPFIDKDQITDQGTPTLTTNSFPA
jgi:hypothetical protein